MRLRPLLLVFLLSSDFAWSQAKPAPRAISNPQERTARYLESVRHQPSLLLAFVRALPKGGDLHNHLSGSIYAESYIRWAAEDGLCLNRTTLAFAAPPCDPEKGTIPAQQIQREPGLYQQVINAQSMRFFNGPESGHDHFFATFGKFGAVSRNHQGDMLAEILSRAATQHVSLVSTLLAADTGEASRFPKENGIEWNGDLAALRKSLLDEGLGNVVAHAKQNLDRWESRKNEVLHCGAPQADPGCDVIVRYQFEVHRGFAPEQVFAEMLTGFELANSDPRVVDVNPVMPEDAYVPMRDFELHMRMLDYLHGVYPKVHLSLHAGELWTGLVPPDGLRFHIRDSIEKGHAERIGHGVDVMFEDDPIGLLREMAAKKIAVEINLASNDLILGVRGDEHPLPMYLRFGVPVMISTDDEGVSRSDITQEYMRALSTYNISYQQLKQMVRNSLEYSFLPGESLWSDYHSGKRNPGCARDLPSENKPSNLCEQFLSKSERARAQWKLEEEFARFEAGSCCTATARAAR